MPTPDLDRMRADVLDRMERSDRLVRWAILLAALFELLLFVAAFLLIDWRDPLQKLVFVLAVSGYTIVVLGLVALGGHMTRVGDRVLAALDGAGHA
jgi:fatty acid desaturase